MEPENIEQVENENKTLWDKVKDTLESIAGIVVLLILLALFGYYTKGMEVDESPGVIYNKNNIEVMYIQGNSFIEVKNNTSENIEIEIGNDRFSISNTKNDYIVLGVNSGQGKVVIAINGEQVEIDYETL